VSDMSTDLGPALHSLTGDQPLQPPDRLASVTRRAGRIRRTRAAAAVAAVVVVASSVTLLSGSLGTTPKRPAYASASEWPDRSPRHDRARAEGARNAFVNSEGDGASVAWLYRGVVERTAPEDAYLAVFRGVRQGRHVLVLGEIDLSRPSSEVPLSSSAVRETSSWTFQEIDLDTHPETKLVSTAITRMRSGQLSTIIFALGPPGTKRMGFAIAGLPGRLGSGSGDGEAKNGLYVQRLGAPLGPVSIVLDGRSYPLGGHVTYAHVDPPGVPAGWQVVSGHGDQTEQQPDRMWMAALLGEQLTADPRPLTLLGRCVGGGSLKVALHRPRAVVRPGQDPEPLQAEGRFMCDGQTHRVLGPVALDLTNLFWRVTGDRLQIFDLQLGTPAR
jgi:hypothetical protein